MINISDVKERKKLRISGLFKDLALETRNGIEPKNRSGYLVLKTGRKKPVLKTGSDIRS